MEHILGTIIAFTRDSSIGEKIPDLDRISEKDLRKAGIDADVKKELIDSQGKCKQLLNAIYNKFSSIKVSRIKDELRREKIQVDKIVVQKEIKSSEGITKRR